MSIFVLTRARIAQVVVLVAAIVALLIGFDIVSWTEVQAGLVATEASAVLILILAVQQHYRPNSAEEPIAVAGSITAAATSTCALLIGFDVVDWTPRQVALLLAALAAVLTLVGSWAARSVVTAKQTPDA